LQGAYKSYYEDGSEYFEKNYINGQLHGTSREFYENEVPKSVENYYYDTLNGLISIIFPTAI
jgi:antitoxin component YwqK of YwqJK toxin-antitoxin module